MSFSIKGKTAIVTGAANGCGLAIGKHFLEKGAQVVFADVDEAALASLAADLPSDTKARIFGGDLRKKLNVANLLSETIDAFEGVDILVNAARRITVNRGGIASCAEMTDALEANVTMPLRVSELVAKHMIKQAEGSERPSCGAIVNLSSIAGRRTQPELMAYSVAAAALEQMTRAMAVSLAPHRIRVNAVAFGSVMSATLQKALRDDDEFRRRIVEATPLGKIAPAAELVDTVQYLSSDAARFVTGEVVTVDGGRTLIDPVVGPAH